MILKPTIEKRAPDPLPDIAKAAESGRSVDGPAAPRLMEASQLLPLARSPEPLVPAQ